MVLFFGLRGDLVYSLNLSAWLFLYSWAKFYFILFFFGKSRV